MVEIGSHDSSLGNRMSGRRKFRDDVIGIQVRKPQRLNDEETAYFEEIRKAVEFWKRYKFPAGGQQGAWGCMRVLINAYRVEARKQKEAQAKAEKKGEKPTKKTTKKTKTRKKK
jgi:hypothetical protein